jgi:hypothetical protein
MIDTNVNIDAINLMKLSDGVFVIVHGLIALRENSKNVLVQINPRSNYDTPGGNQHRCQQHCAPVRRQPQI